MMKYSASNLFPLKNLNYVHNRKGLGAWHSSWQAQMMNRPTEAVCDTQASADNNKEFALHPYL